jgi:adenine-specific DNA methylase
VIDGDEVKRQAQAGQMGEQLFAVVYKRRVVSKTKTGKDKVKWERNYRSPRSEDDNSASILARLAEKLPEWEALDIIPNEAYGDMYCDRSKIYGVNFWRDLFSPRQLLSIGTSVEVFTELLREEKERGSLTEAKRASFVYLAFAIDKIADYNALAMSSGDMIFHSCGPTQNWRFSSRDSDLIGQCRPFRIALKNSLRWHVLMESGAWTAES